MKSKSGSKYNKYLLQFGSENAEELYCQMVNYLSENGIGFRSIDKENILKPSYYVADNELQIHYREFFHYKNATVMIDAYRDIEDDFSVELVSDGDLEEIVKELSAKFPLIEKDKI